MSAQFSQRIFGGGHHRLVLGLLGLEVRDEPRQGRDLLLPLGHRRRGLRCRVPTRAVTLEEDEGRIRRGKKTKRSQKPKCRW